MFEFIDFVLVMMAGYVVVGVLDFRERFMAKKFMSHIGNKDV